MKNLAIVVITCVLCALFRHQLRNFYVRAEGGLAVIILVLSILGLVKTFE
jgi:hypothetical protein